MKVIIDNRTSLKDSVVLRWVGMHIDTITEESYSGWIVQNVEVGHSLDFHKNGKSVTFIATEFKKVQA